jgi:hypothetical protein
MDRWRDPHIRREDAVKAENVSYGSCRVNGNAIRDSNVQSSVDERLFFQTNREGAMHLKTQNGVSTYLHESQRIE